MVATGGNSEVVVCLEHGIVVREQGTGRPEKRTVIWGGL